MKDINITTCYYEKKTMCTNRSRPQIGIAEGIIAVFLCCLLLGSTVEGATGREIVFKSSGVYTLEELSNRIREGRGPEVYVNRADEKRKVFISAGTYDAQQLIRLTGAATGLKAKAVKEVLFLTKPTAPDLRFPLYPEPERKRLGELLLPIALKVDLKKEAIPFPNEWFLKRSSLPFAQLTEEQRSFVVKTWLTIAHRDATRPGIAETAVPEADLHSGIEQLKGATIRFGTSFMFVIGMYQKDPLKSEVLNQSGLAALQQVYYDYADELGGSTER